MNRCSMCVVTWPGCAQMRLCWAWRWPRSPRPAVAEESHTIAMAFTAAQFKLPALVVQVAAAGLEVQMQTVNASIAQVQGELSQFSNFTIVAEPRDVHDHVHDHLRDFN